jgi:hypothetical protein
VDGGTDFDLCQTTNWRDQHITSHPNTVHNHLHSSHFLRLLGYHARPALLRPLQQEAQALASAQGGVPCPHSPEHRDRNAPGRVSGPCNAADIRPSNSHTASDNTIITPSPLRAALAYSDADDEHRYHDVEELAEEHEYTPEYEYAYTHSQEPETPPTFDNDDDPAQLTDEDLLSRLLRREREYTRLQVYYEELHRRYADSKKQIEHLNRQVDALGARMERKERRIRLLKVLAIRR